MYFRGGGRLISVQLLIIFRCDVLSAPQVYLLCNSDVPQVYLLCTSANSAVPQVYLLYTSDTSVVPQVYLLCTSGVHLVYPLRSSGVKRIMYVDAMVDVNTTYFQSGNPRETTFAWMIMSRTEKK